MKCSKCGSPLKGRGASLLQDYPEYAESHSNLCGYCEYLALHEYSPDEEAMVTEEYFKAFEAADELNKGI